MRTNCSTPDMSSGGYYRRPARRLRLSRMTSDLDLRGVWVPLITPFDADGAVDVDAIERLCREYLAAGATGIVALGTTGEATRARRGREARRHRRVRPRVCAARTRRSSSAPAPTTRARRSRRREALAGDRRVSSARSSSCRTTCGRRRPAIVAHMQAVADASPVPIVLYNIPYRTGRGLGAASLLELAAHPEHRGVKQAVGALDADTLASARGRAARLRGARRRGRDPVPDHVHGRRRARSRRRPTCARSASSR